MGRSLTRPRGGVQVGGGKGKFRRSRPRPVTGSAGRGGSGLLSGRTMTHPACAERLPPGPRGLQTAASPSDLSAFGSCALADLPPGHGSAFLPRVLLPRHVTRTTPSVSSLHLRAGSELEALKNTKTKTQKIYDHRENAGPCRISEAPSASVCPVGGHRPPRPGRRSAPCAAHPVPVGHGRGVHDARRTRAHTARRAREKPANGNRESRTTTAGRRAAPGSRAFRLCETL